MKLTDIGWPTKVVRCMLSVLYYIVFIMRSSNPYKA